MFYMNTSNLLIKITELSIEKVSNRIQTIQMLSCQKLKYVELFLYTQILAKKIKDGGQRTQVSKGSLLKSQGE